MKLVSRSDCDYCSADSMTCYECGGSGRRSFPRAGVARSAPNAARSYWLAWYSRQRRAGRYIDREFSFEPLLPRWAAKRLGDYKWLLKCREEGFTGTVDQAAAMPFTERLKIVYSMRKIQAVAYTESPFLKMIRKAS